VKAEPQKAKAVPIAPVPARLLRRKCACGGTPGPDGECAECRKKRLGLQRKATGPGGPMAVPPIVHEVLGSSGRPLDGGTRSVMESRFGHDFSRVRIHADSHAARSAQAVDALAYTVGPDIVFDEGRYSPGSPEGLKLLAHELVHVVQQEDGAGAPEVIGPADDPAERVADAVAGRVVAQQAAPAIGSGSGGRLQRVVNERKVGCRTTGVPSLGLSGADAVTAITDANSEAIDLARLAEISLFVERETYSPASVDANFATILLEELGLDMANARHRAVTSTLEQRFNLIRTRFLESDYVGYTCIGAANVSLGGGAVAGPCCTGAARACAGSGVSHIVLCRPWWTGDVSHRAGTLVHEPLHAYFNLDDHTAKLNDAHCYTAFAQRLGGVTPLVTCAGR